MSRHKIYRVPATGFRPLYYVSNMPQKVPRVPPAASPWSFPAQWRKTICPSPNYSRLGTGLAGLGLDTVHEGSCEERATRLRSALQCHPILPPKYGAAAKAARPTLRGLSLKNHVLRGLRYLPIGVYASVVAGYRNECRARSFPASADGGRPRIIAAARPFFSAI